MDVVRVRCQVSLQSWRHARLQAYSWPSFRRPGDTFKGLTGKSGPRNESYRSMADSQLTEKLHGDDAASPAVQQLIANQFRVSDEYVDVAGGSAVVWSWSASRVGKSIEDFNATTEHQGRWW